MKRIVASALGLTVVAAALGEPAGDARDLCADPVRARLCSPAPEPRQDLDETAEKDAVKRPVDRQQFPPQAMPPGRGSQWAALPIIRQWWPPEEAGRNAVLLHTTWAASPTTKEQPPPPNHVQPEPTERGQLPQGETTL